MRVAVVGGGYVGVVTGVAFALHGHEVTVLERVPEVAARISAGKAPFHEPGLDDALARAVAAGSLHASADLPAAVAASEYVFLCVGTPQGEDGGIDLSDLESAARAVVAAAPADGMRRVLAVKSTVVPGTAERLAATVATDEAAWGVASNPEFLREGEAVGDAMHPDRVVIGARDAWTAERLAALYEPFGAPVVQLPPAAAELVKYTSNALLAALISFSNEVADLCEQLPGVSAAEVFRALHLDRRLAPEGPERAPGIVSYLWPGCGYGGSCLPKDVSALEHFARSVGRPSGLIEATRRVNAGRPLRLVERVRDVLGGLDGREVAVLGLAFKPDTDDMRESPAIPVVEALLDAGARVRAHDPAALERARERWGERSRLRYEPSLEGALRGADGAVLVTAWPEFGSLTGAYLRETMRRPLVVDGRLALGGLQGVEYRGVGLG